MLPLEEVLPPEKEGSNPLQKWQGLEGTKEASVYYLECFNVFDGFLLGFMDIWDGYFENGTGCLVRMSILKRILDIWNVNFAQGT